MKIINIVYILLFFSAIAGILLVTDYYNLQWYYNLLFLSIFFFIALVIIFLKRYFSRKKNKNFIKRVITQEDSLYSQEKDRRNSIEELFSRGIKSLNDSTLKLKGENPIYSYPWYCFLGEENSGKNTFLDNSNLLTSLGKVFIDNKKYFSWWFFEKLVILDLSSNYTSLKNDTTIENEWEKILQQFSKYRVKEPINGVIVTISVDTLLEDDEIILKNKANLIRKRINQIMGEISANFPVYIMVTKIDKLLGATDFFGLIQSELFSNSYGYVNNNYDFESNEILENKIEDIFRLLNLKNKNLIIKYIGNENKNSQLIYQYTKEFDLLNNKLKIYLTNIFRINEYQYVPKFRGVFYSSAKINDLELKSDFKNKYLQNIDFKHNLKVNNIFIEKFFTKNLINDRYIYEYLQEFITWKKALRNISITIFLFLFLFLTSFSYISYEQNRKLIKSLDSSYFKIEKNDFNVNINQLYTAMVSIQQVEKNIKSNFFIKYGFFQGKESFEIILKQFLKNFELLIMDEIENKFIDYKRRDFLKQSEYEKVLNFLLSNINLNKTLIKGYKVLFTQNDKSIIKDYLIILGIDSFDISNKFNLVYEYYLNSLNKSSLEKREYILNKQFNDFLTLTKKDYSWLKIKEITNTENIYVENFVLTSNGIKKNSDFILGAYTINGKENIEMYLKKVEKNLEVNEYLNSFWEDYDKDYIKSWKNFITNFYENLDKNLLLDQVNFFVFLSEDNPFNLLINKAALELEPYKNQEKWIEELIALSEYIKLAQKNKDVNNLKETIADTLSKEIQLSGSKISKEYAKKINNSLILTEYYNTLKDFPINNFSSEMKNIFNIEVSGNSVFLDSFNILNKFMYEVNQEIKTSIIKEFMSAQLKFILENLIQKESCLINKKWQKEILYKYEDVETKVVNKFFNDINGEIKLFLEKNLNAYLEVEKNNYKKKNILNNYSLPFYEDFFEFINSGFELSKYYKENYFIKLYTYPISTNLSSNMTPYSSKIEVSCNESIFELENFNFKDTKLLQWNSSNCKKTKFKIIFKDYILEKEYEGSFSFLTFMNELILNSYKLNEKNFENENKFFKENNIEYINIGFKFDGEYKEALNLLNPIPYKLPKNILRCKND